MPAKIKDVTLNNKKNNRKNNLHTIKSNQKDEDWNR